MTALLTLLLAAAPQEVGPNDFRISEMGPTGALNTWAAAPEVAYNPLEHEFLVVWAGQDFNIKQIYGQRIDAATGAEVGADDFPISKLGRDSPHVVHNPNANEYLVVFGGGGEAFGQRLDASGAQIGADDFRISTDANKGPFSPIIEPRAAFDPIRNQYLVVFSGDVFPSNDGDHDIEIHGQFLDGSSGDEIGIDDFRISAMGPEGGFEQQAVQPDVAFGGDEFLVVWRGDPPFGASEIFGQRLDAITGLEAGPDDFSISDAAPELTYSSQPAVVHDPATDHYLVSWTGGAGDVPAVVLAQRVTADGTPLFTPDLAISSKGSDVPVESAVLYDGADGEFLVAWNQSLAAFPLTPEDHVAADFDNDGHTDLVATDAGMGVSFLRGNAAEASLALPESSPAGRHLGQLVLAHLDGDGQLDLVGVEVGLGDADVVLLRGDGTGHFEPTATLDLSAARAAAGDLDANGTADLVVTHANDDVSVLLGLGDGTFGPANTFPASFAPRHPVLGDVDADGDLDLVVGDTQAQRIVVLLGSGDGTFGVPWSLVTNGELDDLLLADFDGDGWLDIAAAGPVDHFLPAGGVALLLGQGDGTFAPETQLPFGFDRYGLAAADLDGDALADLIVTLRTSGQVLSLLSDGSGGFAAPLVHPGGPLPVRPVVADVDGDALPDVAVLNASGSGLLAGLGGGAFAALERLGGVEEEILVQRVSATGALVGPSQRRVSDMGPAGHPLANATAPALAQETASGTNLVAWRGTNLPTDTSPGESEIYGQRLRSCAGVTAQEIVRAGTPPNPVVLHPTGAGPFPGLPWQPRIDHASFARGAIADLLLVSTVPVEVPLGVEGTLLCAPVAPFALLLAAPGNAFELPVPGLCGLAGLTLCAQGAALFPSSFALTNALDATVGHD